MTTAARDVVDIVKAALLLNTGITSEVGSNIWNPIAVAGWKNTTPAIVFGVMTSQPELEHGSFMSRVVFRCYGGSAKYSDARRIARAVYEMFQDFIVGIETDKGEIIKASVSTINEAIKEPETGFPVAYLVANLVTI